MNVLITNCSNNYGPKQHYEKLIPTIIKNALAHKPIPIYGDLERMFVIGCMFWIIVRH